jgi:hypothetical protein
VIASIVATTGYFVRLLPKISGESMPSVTGYLFVSKNKEKLSKDGMELLASKHNHLPKVTEWFGRIFIGWHEFFQKIRPKLLFHYTSSVVSVVCFPRKQNVRHRSQVMSKLNTTHRSTYGSGTLYGGENVARL